MGYALQAHLASGVGLDAVIADRADVLHFAEVSLARRGFTLGRAGRCDDRLVPR